MLGRHDYRYVGLALGMHLEQCEYCHRLRPRSKAMHTWHSARESAEQASPPPR